MSMFSLQCCYAALTAYASEGGGLLDCSREDLSNQVQAFIQRDGLVAKADRSILKKVQNDFLFASYLLFCQEHGNFAPLEYIDEYITGCALEELLAFDAPIESRNHCHTNVYLDTGFIFALLGIESANRSEHFKALLDDMVSLGMRLNIFEHTYAEISSIIASSAHWIGNPYYDPSEASEATYFFASNGWSRQRVNELVSNLRSILIENYSIKIDNTRYPLKEDIRTMYQENIKEQIVAEYSATNPRFSLEEKAQTIEFDSRSLFMLLHYNDGFSAQTLPDLKYIFVTTNRSLARVGKKIALKSFRGNANGIPIAINDLVWGSLIWSHSPTKISGLNKASIISAAFAAFMPTEAMLKKLNKFVFTFIPNPRSTLVDVAEEIVKRIELDPQKFIEFRVPIYILENLELVEIEDPTIPLSTISKYYDISKALHIFFVLSNQAGDIWVEDGLRYYMHSKEAGRHNLPHIHVDYKHECSATISLYDGKMVDGDMPRRVMKRASKKIMDNQRYLMECWNKLTDGLRIDLNVYFGVTPLKL